MRAPAASRRCIEPVTWPAAPQKVSLAVLLELLVSTPFTVNSSSCPEDPVPRIAQSGQNVTVRVELAVESGGVDRHLGMGIQHRLDPLRRRDEAEKPDPGGAGGAELADGRGGRGARGGDGGGGAAGPGRRGRASDRGRRSRGRFPPRGPCSSSSPVAGCRGRGRA